MKEGLGDLPEAQKELFREDIWWITDKYINLAVAMVAEQFINEETPNYKHAGELVERINYVFRQHCPIAYSYFFDRTGEDILPSGAVAIVIDVIKRERPLFAVGGITLGQLNSIIQPSAKGQGYLG
jgi:hypothetical protein